MLPPVIFKNVFDAYNFSIISNLFDSYKPYASKARIIKNVRTKCIIFGEALRIWCQKIKQNLPQNYLKNTKIAITACKLLNFSGGACLRSPLKHFLFLNYLRQISSAAKNAQEKIMEIMPRPF